MSHWVCPMSQRSIPGSRDLGKTIKERRIELDLTIEEAADRAGVGIKTRCRYEAGESIRHDKAKGVCKALNWRGLPSSQGINDTSLDINEYRMNKYWSKMLEERFGATAAAFLSSGATVQPETLYRTSKLIQITLKFRVFFCNITLSGDAQNQSTEYYYDVV